MNFKTMVKKVINKFNKQILGQGTVNFRRQGVINLIDIGSVGDLPSPWQENAPKIHNLLKFEPREKSVQNSYVKSINTAVWETNETKNLYIYKGFCGSGSSLFEQNYEYVTENFEKLKHQGPQELANTWFERSKLDKIETIDCRRLDDILQDLGHPFPYHFLKIDAQGAEYQILKGAENFLSEDCLGLHLELFTIPLYKEIKLLPEVALYLEKFDFKLVKKFPAHGSFDSQHDCLFLKNKGNDDLLKIIRKLYKV